MVPNWHKTYHPLTCECNDCLIGYPAELPVSVVAYPGVSERATTAGGNRAERAIMAMLQVQTSVTADEIIRRYGLSWSYVRSTLQRMTAQGVLVIASVEHGTKTFQATVAADNYR